jgi:hypothetical protein
MLPPLLIQMRLSYIIKRPGTIAAMSTRVLIHHYSPTGTEEQWQRNDVTEGVERGDLP